MLAIAIAERYSKELVDLLPEDAKVPKRDSDEVFCNTVVWREPDSFSDRTLELLNQLRGSGYLHPKLDILLKLSTEPGHPWNAKLLHRNLLDDEIAKRDQLWSTQLALDYGSEENDGYESTIRTLIEWASYGDIEEVEEERIRLCSIILMWFHTTSNRKVRDRSTKALVRLLSQFPSLLPGLLRKFHSVNDPYVVERLYAVAYGVLCNMNDPQIISQIATLVFEFVFEDGKPAPHILLRDYARGILELALHRNLLPDDVGVEQFRPPYESAWPIENPTSEEIDTIVGDEHHAWIERSVMDVFGDFGTYTMSCVHDWSPTSMTEHCPETGYELKMQFAETHLQGEVKTRFLEEIQPSESERGDSQSTSTALRELLLDIDLEGGTFEDENQLRESTQIQFATYDESKREREREEEEELRKLVRAQLGDSEREYFRWLSGLRDDGPAQFSRKWAQRWVCKRAYEFGWTEELFSQFDGNYPVRNDGTRGKQEIERIGKKYQWLALHEFLARLSDNVHWVGRDYGDQENGSYNGPWQIHIRDIDPTFGIRKNAGHQSHQSYVNTWWQPYNFSLGDLTGFSEQQEYLWDEQQLPSFQNLLQVEESDTQSQWTILRGFWIEDQKDLHNNPNFARLKCWFRINSIFVFKEALEVAVEEFKERFLSDPHIIHVPSTDYQSFLGEYPWHPVYSLMSGWQNTHRFERSRLSKYFSPVAEYNWEFGDSNGDFSLDSHPSFYLPATELVESKHLRRAERNDGLWENDDGVIFKDPS